jgi:hypothetical protein
VDSLSGDIHTVSPIQDNFQQEMEMIKPGKPLSALVLVSALFVSVYGCQPKEGPVEKAGKEVDKAAATVGQQIEKAGDNIQDAAKGEKK